jgi:hypothetical protein
MDTGIESKCSMMAITVAQLDHRDTGIVRGVDTMELNDTCDSVDSTWTYEDVVHLECDSLLENKYREMAVV